MAPGQFSTGPLFQNIGVYFESLFTNLSSWRGINIDCTIRTLFVHLGLFTVCLWYVKLIGYNRIPSRHLIHTGHTVPEVLPSNKYRHLNVKLEFNHLKGCIVPVPHQISDEAFVRSRSLCTVSIRNTCRLDNS